MGVGLEGARAALPWWQEQVEWGKAQARWGVAATQRVARAMVPGPQGAGAGAEAEAAEGAGGEAQGHGEITAAPPER